MATTDTGYLQDGGSNVDAVSISNGSATDGDSLGAWLAGTLLLKLQQSTGSPINIKIKMQVSPDNSEWFDWRTLTVIDATSGTNYTRTLPLGSNGEVGDRGFFEYIRIINETGSSVTTTARYNVIL